MPNYTIRNRRSGRTIERFMSIAEMEQYEIDRPGWEVMPGKPLICYNWTDRKPSDAFRDRLKEIKKAHPGSTINIQ